MVLSKRFGPESKGQRGSRVTSVIYCRNVTCRSVGQAGKQETGPDNRNSKTGERKKPRKTFGYKLVESEW